MPPITSQLRSLGAYGHSELREFILGGAMRSATDEPAGLIKRAIAHYVFTLTTVRP